MLPNTTEHDPPDVSPAEADNTSHTDEEGTEARPGGHLQGGHLAEGLALLEA